MTEDIILYVRNYLKVNHATYCNNIKRKELDAIIVGISKSVRNKYKNGNEILMGNADKFISSVVNKYMYDKHQEFIVRYVNFKNYISRYVLENIHILKEQKKNFSKKDLSFFVEDICCELMPTYNYNSVMEKGGLEEEITSCLQKVISNCFDHVCSYVAKYISNNVIPLTDIDEKMVAKQVIEMIEKSEINIVDILLGRYDEKIYAIAEENRKYNQDKRLADNPDTLQYIRNLIPNNRLNEDLVEKFVISMDNKLRDRKLTSKEIVSGSYDKEILIDFNKYLAQHLRFDTFSNSVQTEGIEDGFKLENGKNKLKKNISTAIMTILLTGVLSVTLNQYFREIKTDAIKKNIRKEIGVSDNIIDNIYDKYFDGTKEGAINGYNIYSGYKNDNFKYLGFYAAFERCSSDERFHIMDKMLKDIKEEIKYNVDYNDLSVNLNGNGNYLSFIYDRLEEMGYTEIRDDKYQDLLFAYSKARNQHELGNPVEYLNNSQERLLNEVSRKYKEYSEQCLLELNVLRNQEKYGDGFSTGGGRRN